MEISLILLHLHTKIVILVKVRSIKVLTVENKASILDFKTFSQLECTSILTEQCRAYLDKYQSLKDDEYYTQKILTALYSLLTFVNANQPTVTTHRKSFQLYDEKSKMKVERFDKLIDQVRMSVKSKVHNDS